MTPAADELPALLGGPPVRPAGPPPWPGDDPAVVDALRATFASGAWGQYHGLNVPDLEAEIADFHDVPHVLTCASGTLAVEAALRAMQVGPGDEVILAAYEYESNFLTVHALGARPVLADVEPRNWNLTPDAVADAVSPATKAVVCSHLHGGLVPMREITALAQRHGFGVVEDAAQAPGATVQGRPAGTWGGVGTLSFGGSKLLSAGRGGALLFRDGRLYQRAKLWLSRGVQQWAPLSELQAAVLRPQLARLSSDTQRTGAVRCRAVRSGRARTSSWIGAVRERTAGVPGRLLQAGLPVRRDGVRHWPRVVRPGAAGGRGLVRRGLPGSARRPVLVALPGRGGAGGSRPPPTTAASCCTTRSCSTAGRERRTWPGRWRRCIVTASGSG